ncbi:hypothetical protein PG994_004844 [Apiospora phragmitis]|uniref:Uncharacterized protein n=1 Tax=Apiospora phragmitis TaxID=2905665 RepID=A0ABR1VRR1_9PEZI
MISSTNEEQLGSMRVGITAVNSGFSTTSTLIEDDSEPGVEDKENATRPKTSKAQSELKEPEKQSTRNTSSKLRLWGQIQSGLTRSFRPVDLYKMSCHLWHVLQDYWWLWELVTISMSFASMAAVVVILAVEDGKSLDDWVFPIQPNSLISIFITLSKSAIMSALTGAIAQSMWTQFEQNLTPLMRVEEIQEAGRGPWGSIKLLMAMIKGKRFNLIAISGAAITVATLALDPFVQQVMSFPSRTIPAKEGKAVFKSTQTWRDLDMTSVQGAILGGVYRNPQITNYTCTESSCSWPTITTLGVCSTCQDLTSKADVKCSTTPGPMTPSKSDSWTFETTNCNHTVGGNITIPAYMQTMSFPGGSGEQGEHLSQWTNIKLLPQDGYENYSAKHMLGEMISPEVNYWFTTVLSYSTFFDSRINPLPKVTPDLLAPQIMGCGLHPCGQVWDSPSVVNGTMANGGAPTSSAPLQLMFNDVINTKGSASFPGNGTFTVSRSVATNLTQLITQMYHVTSMNGNDNFGDAFPEADKGMYGLTAALFDVNVDIHEGNQTAADSGGAGAVMTAQSPVASFARAARGLSEYVRNQDDYDAAQYVEHQEDWNGKAWRQETYIKVRWAFLTLPLLVLVATLALLCAAVRRSRGKGARVWKSSSLALLFHDVYTEVAVVEEEEEREEEAGLRGGNPMDRNQRMKQESEPDLAVRQWRFEADSIKSMNEKAEKAKARLAADSDRFSFVVSQ